MVGSELCLDVFAIFLRLPVQILVSVSSSKGLHVAHPEVVGVGAERADGLLERQLDLEPQAVETDDLERIEGQIGRHQDALASGGMIDEDEPNEDSDRPPQQI